MIRYIDFGICSMALCAWREARNQGRDGIRGVCHVISNRAIAAKKSVPEVIYEKLQFSSMTYPHDPQLTLVPTLNDPEFKTCMEVAELVYCGSDFDLTQGADHYFSDIIPKPDWANRMKFLIKIGNHSYYYGGYHAPAPKLDIATGDSTTSTTENPQS